MSTPLRLAKGAGLTLGRVCVGIIGQVATVPIYLSHWDATTYGIWLILQGLLGYLTLVSTALQQYTYAEVLKQGPNEPNAVRKVYWASLAVGYLIAAAEFAAIVVFAASAVSASLPEDSAVYTNTVVRLLLLFGVLNLVLTPFGAITSQTMAIHGYYPRSAAWGLLHVVVTLFTPALAVLLGADLMTAGLVQVVMHMSSGILMMIDFGNLARKHGLLARTPIEWRWGFFAALRCLPLAGRTFIDSFRQQGFRILLGAYAGATAVTALATTRTFANVLHQGLSTITAPLMPELMRYVVNRDQIRLEGAFAIVWLSLFVLLVPGMLLLCLVAEPFFVLWTQGVVGFDPVLFLTLLVVVLLYASGQPANAILQGQNRISWMISISVLAALALAVFSLLLIPSLGLRGAGFILLGVELFATVLTVTGAFRALRQSRLKFPLISFALVATMVGTVFGLTLLALTVFDEWPVVMTLPFAANALFGALYWRTIPTEVRIRILSVLGAMRARLPRRICAHASETK